MLHHTNGEYNTRLNRKYEFDDKTRNEVIDSYNNDPFDVNYNYNYNNKEARLIISKIARSNYHNVMPIDKHFANLSKDVSLLVDQTHLDPFVITGLLNDGVPARDIYKHGQVLRDALSKGSMGISKPYEAAKYLRKDVNKQIEDLDYECTRRGINLFREYKNRKQDIMDIYRLLLNRS